MLQVHERSSIRASHEFWGLRLSLAGFIRKRYAGPNRDREMLISKTNLERHNRFTFMRSLTIFKKVNVWLFKLPKLRLSTL
jgi:hypothetical protein